MGKLMSLGVASRVCFAFRAVIGCQSRDVLAACQSLRSAPSWHQRASSSFSLRLPRVQSPSPVQPLQTGEDYLPLLYLERQCLERIPSSYSRLEGVHLPRGNARPGALGQLVVP